MREQYSKIANEILEERASLNSSLDYKLELLMEALENKSPSLALKLYNLNIVIKNRENIIKKLTNELSAIENKLQKNNI